jgi:hypothetical protein
MKGHLTTLLIAGALLFTEAVSVQGQIIYWPTTANELARQRASRISCVNHLKQIGVGARMWNLDNEPFYPPSLQLLAEDRDFQGWDYLGPVPALVFCPADVGRRLPTNWADVNWAGIDYTWTPLPTSSGDETNICSTCRIHTHQLEMSGAVQLDTERSGWPAIIAAPLGQSVTPGSEVQFEVRVAPDALLPVSYHWWRGPLYITNATFFVDTNHPDGGFWITNLVANLGVTNLAGETNPILVIHNTQTNASDIYCVAVSNSMGTTVSLAILHVDPATPTLATNEHWSEVNCLNNLKQIALFAKLWAGDHGDHMPKSLSEMTNSYGLPIFGWPVLLFCRSDTTRTVPADWSGVDFADTSYEILSSDETNPYDVFCRCKVHGNYGQMDGAVVSQPSFGGIRCLTNKTIELRLKVFAGRTNLLEATPNLVNWTNLATYSATNGSFLFYETNNSPVRFYRIRLP